MTTLDDLLRLVAELPVRRPAAGQPARLDPLFRELARPSPGRPAHELEELIWGLWASHPDAAAEERLDLANRALASGKYRQARQLLDPLVSEYPQWAEAWNKRATLAYLEQREADSFVDIARTLELEPRHFGALCGLGQICLRREAHGAALVAFEAALAINPHLPGIRALTDELRSPAEHALH